MKARTTATFVRPFRVPSHNELLPAGKYEVEIEVAPPSEYRDPAEWRASVLIHLQPTVASPGLSRTLTVPLTELERAQQEDRLSGTPLAEFLLEELLSDPMVRTVMASDGVTESEIRRLYSNCTPAPAEASEASATFRNAHKSEGTR
jgi:hypothetical protein